MENKAFNKLLSEAEEAIAARSFVDLLTIIEAIYNDTSKMSCKDETTPLLTAYEGLIDCMIDGSRPDLTEEVNRLYTKAIALMHQAKRTWLCEHPNNCYGFTLSQISTYREDFLQAQQHLLNRNYTVGEKAYFETIDTVFMLLWAMSVPPTYVPKCTDSLLKTNSFIRRTIVGALFLSIIEVFSETKLQLLLNLVQSVRADYNRASLLTDDEQRAAQYEAEDMLARIAVALTIIYARYQPFFNYYTDLAQQLRAFFSSDLLRPHLPTLQHAIICQALYDRVERRVDDILPFIKEAFEDVQPRLGSSQDKDEQLSSDFEIHVTKLDGKEGNRVFKRLQEHARKVNEMRQSGMDVNQPSFTHMKEFPFFSLTPHWFYPFTELVPEIQSGITRNNGKRDRMTLSIMDANRFCDSDRYSYASMMGYLRSKGHNKVTDMLHEQLEELEDELEEDDFDDAPSTMQLGLDRYFSYCQDLHRFLYNRKRSDNYPKVFALDDKLLLPLQPLFEGLFTDFESVAPTAETLIQYGANEQAIILLNTIMETNGANADLLFQRGFAFMQMKQWNRALETFQQGLIFEDNDEISLCMAHCFIALHRWEDALPLLIHEEERNNGEEPNSVEEVARCLMQMKRWDEAVQHFFRLEFQGKHLGVAVRGIGWCSLHQGKYERAETYFRKLEPKKTTWEDYLNLGHALWLQGKGSEAVTVYRKSMSTFNCAKKEAKRSFRHWSEAFREDVTDFLDAHFSATEIALMLDAIIIKN